MYTNYARTTNRGGIPFPDWPLLNPSWKLQLNGCELIVA